MKYKVGDLVYSTSWRAKTGYIVGIIYNESDTGALRVYDVQWFDADGPSRMVEKWFEPLTTEVQNEV